MYFSVNMYFSVKILKFLHCRLIMAGLSNYFMKVLDSHFNRTGIYSFNSHIKYYLLTFYLYVKIKTKIASYLSFSSSKNFVKIEIRHIFL